LQAKDENNWQRVYNVVLTVGGKPVLSQAEQRYWRRSEGQCDTEGITFGRKKLQNIWFRRFDERIHGVQQLETAATSTLAHAQQFAVTPTTETATTLIGWAVVEW